MLGSRPRAGRAIVLVLIALVAGCSDDQKIKYHFAAANLDDDSGKPKVTYYRLRIAGKSSNSETNMQLGFYDARALHMLFGEVAKERAAGPADPKLGTMQLSLDPATRSWKLMDDSTRFTILYGTNADTMARQIQAFAQADETGQQIGSLLAMAAGSTTIDALAVAKDRQAIASAAASKTAQAAKQCRAALEGESKDDRLKARDQLLKAFQQAADALGWGKTYWREKMSPEELNAAFENAIADLNARKGK